MPQRLDRFDITVCYAPEARVNAAAISRILIGTRDGGHVPLAQLAEISVVNGAADFTGNAEPVLLCQPRAEQRARPGAG